MRVTVWYDFQCPYARIGVYWLRNAAALRPLDVQWCSFLLEHVNLEPASDPDALWASPEQRRSMLPAAAAQWARSQGDGVFERVQRAFFDALHVDKRKIGKPEIADEVLAEAGVDLRSETLMADRRWLQAARTQHEEAQAMGVFGVPTVQIEDAVPTFVRLTKIPEGAYALDVLDRLSGALLDPVIDELKRIRPSEPSTRPG